MTEPEPRDPRIDAAYRDAATDAPRAEIDDRIRAAAHRAVAAGPQSLEARARADAQRSRVARWRVPVSIAATVVVAVTLAYMMEREDAQLARIDGVPSPAPATPPVVAQAEPAKPAEVVRAQPPAATPPQPSPDLARRTAPTPSSNAAVEPRRADESERIVAPPPPPAPAPAAGALQAVPPAPGTSAPLAKEAERRSAEAQAFPATPAPAMQSAPAPQRETAGASARDRAFADRPDRMERQTAAAEQKVRTPEVWLEDLRRLKAQRRTDDFARELAEFRQRYPDYKLPADLLQ
jgi:hypothetical protein